MSVRSSVGLVGIAFLTLACTQHGLLTPSQRELRRSQISHIRSATPELQNRLSEQGHQGALIVFLPSQQPLTISGISPAHALEPVLESANLNEASGATAVFVYRDDTGLAPEWFLLDDILASIEARNRLSAMSEDLESVRDDFLSVRRSTEDELATLRTGLGDAVEHIRQLQEFGTDTAKLGILQQAQLDELQEQAQLLADSIARLQAGAAIQAETLNEIQVSLRPRLDAIQEQVIEIGEQLKKF